MTASRALLIRKLLFATVLATAASAPPAAMCKNVSAAMCKNDAAHSVPAFAGSGLFDFASRLHQAARAGAAHRTAAAVGRGTKIKILVLGNSVARWNKFMTSHVFRRALHGAFPTLTFELSTGAVEGGFGPSHMLYCGRAEWKDATIVLVHFAELSGGPEGSTDGHDLLEQLLGLPQRPLVLVIKHCSLPQLEILASGGQLPNSSRELQQSLWFRRDKHKAKFLRDEEGARQAVAYAEQQARFERLDTLLVRRMNATLVDSCTLLLSLLRGACAMNAGGTSSGGRGSNGMVRGPRAAARDTGTGTGTGTGAPAGGHVGGHAGGGLGTSVGSRAAFEQLATRMFPFNPKVGLGDPLHPTPDYSELQGCAAAQMIISAPAPASGSVSRGSHASQGLSWDHHVAEQGTGGATKGRLASPVVVRAAETLSPPPNAPLTEPWCLRAGDARFEAAVVANSGWGVRTGGAGGSKRWLQSRTLGAFLQLRLSITTPRLAVEYYKHDSLPLGAVQTMLFLHASSPAAGAQERTRRLKTSSSSQSQPEAPLVRILDGRCSFKDRCPKGQGFYHRALLADRIGGSIEAPVHAILQLVVIPRTDGSNGTDFSLVTVVSEV